jgi:hypothetical protein
MTKSDYVEVARCENNRYALNRASNIAYILTNSVGEENYKTRIKEYYEAQCSYVCFLVPKELEKQAISALGHYGG